jgi:hypothetical protein
MISPVVCGIASRYGARALVLEAAHFRAYDAIYNDVARPVWLGPATIRGTIKIFPIYADCPPDPRVLQR